MKFQFKNILISVFYILSIDQISNKMKTLLNYTRVKRYEKQSGCQIKFIPQGEGGLCIFGDLEKFKIGSTSHLKSNTYIECLGGVSIGEYFHTGRDLCILSSNHNYNNDIKKIPYDDRFILKPVIIKDFVWVGNGVKILPGVTVGEGAIIGMGSVVTKDVPDYAVIGGNPAKILKYRNNELFDKIKKKGDFF